jgi:hypothetical protein
VGLERKCLSDKCRSFSKSPINIWLKPAAPIGIYVLRCCKNQEILRLLLAKVSQRALESIGIRLSFSVDGTESPVEPFLEANLLRICEEAVANAAKHAHPARVEVFLAFTTRSVRLGRPRRWLRIRANSLAGFERYTLRLARH